MPVRDARLPAPATRGRARRTRHPEWSAHQDVVGVVVPLTFRRAARPPARRRSEPTIRRTGARLVGTGWQAEASHGRLRLADEFGGCDPAGHRTAAGGCHRPARPAAYRRNAWPPSVICMKTRSPWSTRGTSSRKVRPCVVRLRRHRARKWRALEILQAELGAPGIVVAGEQAVGPAPCRLLRPGRESWCP